MTIRNLRSTRDPSKLGVALKYITTVFIGVAFNHVGSRICFKCKFIGTRNKQSNSLRPQDARRTNCVTLELYFKATGKGLAWCVRSITFTHHGKYRTRVGCTCISRQHNAIPFVCTLCCAWNRKELLLVKALSLRLGDQHSLPAILACCWYLQSSLFVGSACFSLNLQATQTLHTKLLLVGSQIKQKQ